MAICKWCGKTYTKKHNRQMYCTKKCSKYAHLEQKAIYARKYRRIYTHDERTKYGLGSGFLSNHRKKDFYKEYWAIQYEKRRLRIKE